MSLLHDRQNELFFLHADNDNNETIIKKYYDCVIYDSKQRVHWVTYVVEASRISVSSVRVISL